MQTSIRLIFSAILIFFVWEETGWATAISITLITIGNEISTYTIKTILNTLRTLCLKQKGAI